MRDNDLDTPTPSMTACPHHTCRWSSQASSTLPAARRTRRPCFPRDTPSSRCPSDWGHSSIELMLGVYAHVLPNDDNVLAEGLERMYG
jgi:hypothetical protein